MPKLRINPEWRLLESRVDLEVLGRYLDTVEQTLAFLRDQWRTRLNAELKDATNRDERNWLWHEYEMREANVTRSLRGGFTISLWASYESGVLEVADFLRDKKGLPLRLSDIRGRDWFDQARKYFDGVLVFPLHPEVQDWSSLRVLRSIRNTYAHTNGRIHRMRKSVRKTLERAIDSDTGITYDELYYLRLDGRYLHSSYDLVKHLVRDLVRRALEWTDRESA